LQLLRKFSQPTSRAMNPLARINHLNFDDARLAGARALDGV